MTLLAAFSDSWRRLRQQPGTSLIIVLTLGLGIGMNVGIFSIFEQAVLERLNVPDPGKLVVFSSPGPKSGSISASGSGGSEQVFSYPMFEDLAGESDELIGIAGHRGFAVNLAAGDRTEDASGALVTGNYFDVLALRPASGRFFSEVDVTDQNAPRLAVISHAYWVERFGGSDVVGDTLIVNGEPFELIGVAPEGFRGMNTFGPADVFVPVQMIDEVIQSTSWSLDNRLSYWLYLFGRLAPDATPASAAASLQPLYGAILADVEAPMHENASKTFLEGFTGRPLVLTAAPQGQSNARESARTPLVLLLAVTALVLLVACVNVANLLLAVASRERGEVAVRQALGAGRRHILARQAARILLLGGAGGLAALPIAVATMHLVLSLVPDFARGHVEVALDLPVLGVGLAVTGLAVVVAGLAPILQAGIRRPMESIRDQGARGGGGRTARRFRSGLVGAQIAVSLALLVIAGLFLQSLVNVARVELGLNAERVATFTIAPGRNGYGPQRTLELIDRVERRLRETPGVLGASSSMVPLLADSNWKSNISVQGYEPSPDEDTAVSYNAVGPGFFEALSIPLLSGRGIGAGDIGDRPRVAVVNRAFAKRFDLGDNIIGTRMGVGETRDLDIEIVGLVADAKYSSVKDAAPPQYHLSIRQSPPLGSVHFYVRAQADESALAAAVRSLMRELDPNLPVSDFHSLRDIVDRNVFMERLIGTLAGLFAALATVLAAIGLFGVLSFMLSQRTQEIGLRAALGASPGGLKRMVFGQTLGLTLIGSVIGIGIAAVLGRTASGLLYEVGPLAPSAVLGAVLVIVVVALASAYFPARRAARIHPVEALRHD